ncbi:ABC transporter permease [Mycolicibacterium fallax]|uniref:ABC transporter permease n=1 Tax=Mycolicibacterium fallax TaxID=1793 RepID=UPI00138C7625|nr:ABC transporter permease subunit [Mycolicibacterium fallax]BBY99122.1 ABC transporter permease [Mycolicibacterium fallax]HSA41112.1 ABC transporter permease subunit [Mycobacterium sp.]
MSSQAVRRLPGLARQWLPLLPFAGYVGIFLVVPSVTVLVNAFIVDGSPSSANVGALFSGTALAALGRSLLLSLASALLGAVFGAVLAWLIVAARPESAVRRAGLALCGVLAQFGGVALAFAFMATFGVLGLAGGFLYGMPGLILVYTYFQIPLMVVVFLPALDGLRRQWREAAVGLGASEWQYWREVAVPILWPVFLGSTLLLFANAFAAYATAAALVTQGSPIVPLLIRSALTSEVLLGQTGLAYALACEMIVVVAAVMFGYARLVRRTARWLS